MRYMAKGPKGPKLVDDGPKKVKENIDEIAMLNLSKSENLNKSQRVLGALLVLSVLA